MADEEIIIEIKADGSTSVEGAGFSGPACDKALREIAAVLGTVEDVRKKPEYFGTAAQALKRTA